MTRCPKCNYQRTATDTDKPEDECPSCGIVYLKYIQLLAKKQTECDEQKTKITPKQVLRGVITGLALGITILVLINSMPYTPNKETTSETKSKRQPTPETQDKIPVEFKIDAYGLCSSAVERSARYRFKWTDGFWGSPFSVVDWYDDAQTRLRLYGDKVEFETPFGAWQNQTYHCIVQKEPLKLVSFNIQSGRIR